MIQREFLTLSFDLADNIDSVKQMIYAYRDVPMSVADACLVRMAELSDNAVFF